MRIILLLVLVVVPWLAHAQGIEISGEVNISTFSMSSMKKFQQQNARYNAILLTTTSSFPAFIGYKIYAQRKVSPKISAGIFSGFNTTGGRQTYQDFTGVAYNDIKCMALSGGLIGEYHLKDYKGFEVNAALLLGIIFNRVDLIGVADLTQPVYYIRNESTFRSLNYLVNPGVTLRRAIGKFAIRTQISYEYDFVNDLVHDGDKNKIQMPDGTKLNASWDGLRVGVGVAYRISH